MTTITIVLLFILAVSMLGGLCGLLALSLCRTAKRGDEATRAWCEFQARQDRHLNEVERKRRRRISRSLGRILE